MARRLRGQHLTVNAHARGTRESHFVMDNLTFEFVPEPSSLLLATLGALLLWPLLKRNRA